MKKRMGYLFILSILFMALPMEVTAWIRSVPSSKPNSTDTARAVVQDSSDNVIAAGLIRGVETGQDLTVIKFDANGRILWRTDINGRDNRDDFFTAMALDRYEDVILLGWSYTRTGGVEILVVKIEGATG